MKFAILVWGTRGDYQPTFYLAQALACTGEHTFHMVGSSIVHKFAKTLKIKNLIFHEYVCEKLDRFLQSAEAKKLLATDPRAYEVKGFNLTKWSNVFKVAAEVCENCDVVIAGTDMAYIGAFLSDIFSIPLFTLHFWPPFETSQQPNPQLLAKSSMLPLVNRLSFKVAEIRAMYMMRKAKKWVDKNFPGRTSIKGVSVDWLHSRTAGAVLAYSSSITGKPTDYRIPESALIYSGCLGPLNGVKPELIPGNLPELDQSIVEFCKGCRPIYIGFGSMVQEHEFLYKLAVKISEIFNMKVVLCGDFDESENPMVLCVKSAPHCHLFPLCCCVVFHGGCNTMHQAISAGVPCVICPILPDCDQHYWGDRLFELGCAAKYFPRLELTTERLTKALQYVLTDTCKANVARLRTRMMSENGVEDPSEYAARRILEITEQYDPEEVRKRRVSCFPSSLAVAIAFVLVSIFVAVLVQIARR